MTTTPRHSLALLSAGQAQKEFFHNEALQALDTLVGAAVEEGPRVSPPATPAIGSCYLVADAATGHWAAHDREIASWSAGGWRFHMPVDGMAVFVRSLDLTAVFRSGAWAIGLVRCSAVLVGGEQVVGARAAAIAAPSGGSSVDAQARTTIGLILTALRQHGLIAT